MNTYGIYQGETGIFGDGAIKPMTLLERMKKDVEQSHPISTPVLKTFKPVDMKMPDAMQVRTETPPPDPMTKAIKGANVVNAVNAGLSVGLGIYGLNEVNKMSGPTMLSATAIEAKQIRDTGAQNMAARKGTIDQSVNTALESLRRTGRSDLAPTIMAKEMVARNDAASAIEALRTNIESTNVAAENRVREINATNKMNIGQFNEQIQQSWRQYKSQLGSNVLSSAIQGASQNISAIGQNLYSSALYSEEKRRNDEYMDILRKKEGFF